MVEHLECAVRFGNRNVVRVGKVASSNLAKYMNFKEQGGAVGQLVKATT